MKKYIYLIFYLLSIIICLICKNFIMFFIPIFIISSAKLRIRNDKVINIIFWITVVIALYYFYYLYVGRVNYV